MDTYWYLARLGFPQTRESVPPKGQLFSSPLHHIHLGPPQLILDHLVESTPLTLVEVRGSLGLEVIKLEFILRLKIKRNDWPLSDR